jgi:hypothetical protein
MPASEEAASSDRMTSTCGPHLALRPGIAAMPRAQLATRPAAGSPSLRALAAVRASAAPRTSRCPRQPMGRRPGRRRATAAAAARHPIGGACGPCRAALKPYRKCSRVGSSFRCQPRHGVERCARDGSRGYSGRFACSAPCAATTYKRRKVTRRAICICELRGWGDRDTPTRDC